MVKIVTDSAADFEVEELEKMNVTCLPMYVYFGDREYKENISITKDEFFRMCETEEDFPHTSQPSPADFEELFEEAKEKGEELVYIPMSSQLSGDYQSAKAISESIEYDGLYIIDSLSCTGGQRILVEYAVKLRDEGMSGKEIAEAIEELKPRVLIFTSMNTLEYLCRNGRISKTAYAIATFGQMKPIMYCGPAGKAEIIAKPMGLRKSIAFIVDSVKNELPDEDFPLYIMYTQVRENAYKLRDKLQENGFEVPEERIIPVGAVVGAHIGANACAVAYVRR